MESRLGNAGRSSETVRLKLNMIIARRGATVMAAAATVEASRRQQRASQALGWSNLAPGHKSIIRVRPGSLVSPVEKQKMVTLINDLVDLDNFTEDEER